MPIVHPGATLTPHFREFLPPWLARQSWYLGTGTPALTPVGYFRFEDPAGAVGVETHLVRADGELYQVPLTYRDAPLAGADAALVATTEHSVLGTRWIYDAPADPVWVSELLRMVAGNGTAVPSSKRGVGAAGAHGERTGSFDISPATVTIELTRVLSGPAPEIGPDIAGLATGFWHPDGPDGEPASGCLAVLRRR